VSKSTKQIPRLRLWPYQKNVLFPHDGQFSQAEDLQIIYSGHSFKNILLKIIDNAKEQLHVHTYILAEDDSAREILGHILQAAKRGVEVFIMTDAVGSPWPDPDWSNFFKQEGIHFKSFNSSLETHFFDFSRRAHHKVVCADNQVALVGGLNIAREYIEEETNPPNIRPSLPWLDLAIYIKGPSTFHIQSILLEIYKHDEIHRDWEQMHLPGVFTCDCKKPYRFLLHDGLKGNFTIRERYLTALYQAQSEIILMSGYFVPENLIVRLLIRAKKNGVRVRIFLTHHSDVRSVHLAQTYLYRRLIKHGIEILEWRDSILHAKALFVDGTWLTIGSYNLHYTSTWGNIEANVETTIPQVCQEFSHYIGDYIMPRCSTITHESLGHYGTDFFLGLVSYHLYKSIQFFQVLIVAFFKVSWPKEKN